MKKCKECQKEFEPKNKKGVFCSLSCRQKDYRKNVASKLNELEELKKKSIVEKLIPIVDESNKNTVKLKMLQNKIKPPKYKGESSLDYAIRLSQLGF